MEMMVDNSRVGNEMKDSKRIGSFEMDSREDR